MKQFLYRTIDTDDEGDPLDFGVVRAYERDQAADEIAKHLDTVGLSVQIVRIYQLDDRQAFGVLGSLPPVTYVITPGARA